MDYMDFQQWRAMLLAQRPGLLDFSQTSLYSCLNSLGAQYLVPAPSTDPKAKYRCHVAEAFSTWLHGGEELKSRLLISQGVRHSLSALSPAFRGWLIPQDVYPVYRQLIGDAKTYEAREGLPWKQLESQREWTLLVCDPLKPWGGRISLPQWQHLVEVAELQDGQIVVDGAYGMRPSAQLENALENSARLLFLGSLSKGWLIPGVAGFVYGSSPALERWRPVFAGIPKDEQRLRLAYAALREAPGLPCLVSKTVETAARQASQNLQQAGIPLTAFDGYFASSPWPVFRLLENGILALPASVFGSSYSGSVISCLTFVKAAQF